MKKLKMLSALMTCIIISATFAGMSLVTRPSTAYAGEATNEPLDETNETTENPKPHGTISISGSAFMKCEPNQLIIFLKIIGKDIESAVKARDEAATIIDQVLKALSNLGILDENIGTTSYNIEPTYEWEDGKRVFKGYTASVTIKVTLKKDEFDKAGSVIDKSVDAGAFVDSIQFELSRDKRDELNLQLLAEAAEDAKLKADIIVSALGDELGNVKSVNVGNYDYQPRILWKNEYLYSDDYAASMAPPTTIMPSDLTVSASVSVIFEIL